MFRFLVLSFFISNIMTVLGSVMDGFALSNAMDEGTVAAVGFVSPAVILFSMIGTNVHKKSQQGRYKDRWQSSW